MTAVTSVAAPTPAALSAPSTPPAETPPYLLPDTVAERIARGRVAENTADKINPGLVAAGPPSYFRTYEQVKTALFDLQAKYPNLVQIRDIGDSYEKTTGAADRDILDMTLTNKNAKGPKAIVQHVGGIHAREIANPELLLTFAKQLLEGYGRDPEATAALDNREIDLVPLLNPDGHAFIERAYSRQPRGDLMKRKNASGANGQGTDLNRNFQFHWGGAGASSSPFSETYRGASAASEPETKAAQAFMAERKPTMFTDWHSYSRLNLYPWGDTNAKAPQYEGFKALAEKYSTFNHYSPIQSIQLYPTTGTTDDHAYGTHGIAGMAVETGDAFHQTDQQFAETLRENLPVLWYGTKVAPSPFELVKGPDAIDVVINPESKTVQAKINDTANGANALVAAEIVLDPNAAPGTGVSLTAADGQFNTPTEQVGGSFASLFPGDAPTPKPGTLAYVRGRDSKGNWGPLTAQWLAAPAAPKPPTTPTPPATPPTTPPPSTPPPPQQ
jgi:hypothetical protein